MKIKQFEIWTTNLNPRYGTESGKVRPVLIIQTDLLNNFHSSTIICPVTSNINTESEILRVHLEKGIANLKQDCDILIDQIRAIDNTRLLKKIGELPEIIISRIKNNISIVLDL